MRRIVTAASVGLVLILLAADAHAVPEVMTFSGRVTDASGAIDGSVDLVFEIYDADTAGTVVWTETHSATQADNGVVNLVLGKTDPLNTAVFTGEARFLQITVNTTPQLPRVPIASVPYATKASDADTLAGKSASDFAPASAADRVITVVAGPANVNAASFGTLVITCPATHPVVLGGGVDVENVLTMVVTSSAPRIGGTRTFLATPGNLGPPDGWQGSVRNNDAAARTFKMSVICSQ